MKKALITASGVEAVQVALELAEQGIAVTLVEESAALQVNPPGGQHNHNIAEALPFMPKLLRAATHGNISVITNASLEWVMGEKGNFRVAITRHPRYVNVDACTSCGRCEQACPVNIIAPSADGRDGHKAIHRPDFGLKSVPSAYTIEKKGTPPCTAACPAGINVHGYVSLVAEGKFAEALDLVTEAVAFPRVLGRVCSHPCQSRCTRGKVDQAVSICALKRFVADSNSTESSLKRAQTANNNGIKLTGPPRVAIIGAGPAGLTVARDLARLGHRATVFEALPVPGGMITVGMPRFRLPREVRQADIDDIQRLGIEIRTSTRIGQDLTLQDLRQGYEAILIATGAHKNQRLNIPGENLSGVIDSIALLQAFNLKQPITVGKKVVVVGGGYTAIDSARTAVRLHCDRVRILYRRSQEEMPADADEVAEAQEEGAEIEFLVNPVRIVGHEGKVVGVECIRMSLGEPDLSGRRRPITVGGSEFLVEADTVIVAVGQRPDLSFLGDTTLTDGKKHIVIDPLTMATKVPGIFAAGDVAGQPGTLIEAITEGRRAAVSIDRFLRGEGLSKACHPEKATPVEVDLDEIYIPPIECQPMPRLPPEARIGNFEEVDLGFTAEMAVREAKRCLNCAGCSECRECERACQLNAVDHDSAAQRLELGADVIIAAASQSKGGGDSSAITPRPGIYLMAPASQAGDLSQASAVAAKVVGDLMKHYRASKAGPDTRLIDIHEPLYEAPGNPGARLGIFVCDCGGSIGSIVDIPGVVKHCRRLADVAYSGGIGYACTVEGANEIKRVAGRHSLTHVVLAACSCCNLDQICFSCSDRRLLCKSNLLDGASGISYEFVNIREHCAWVHKPEEATAKARSLIRAGIARARVNHAPVPLAPGESIATGSGLNGRQAVVTIDQLRCRGCGTCLSVCRFDAVSLKEKSDGVFIARVDKALCRGCGACVAHCPSGALSQNGYSDEQITASLQAILAWS